MTPRSLAQRVMDLEQQMDSLKDLPGAVDRIGSQILQSQVENRFEFSAIREETRNEFAAVRQETGNEFGAVREEMRTEFAAVREEMRTEFAAVREEMRTECAAVREEMRTEFGAVREDMRTEFGAVRREMQDLREELREDIRIGVEESQNLTRLLHAEAMQAIATLDATLRRDVIDRLDGLLRLQQRGPDRPA